jgi:integrase
VIRVIKSSESQNVSARGSKSTCPCWILAAVGILAKHRVLTTHQAAQLLDALPPLGRTMAALEMLTGLRRGELFALRWSDLDEHDRCLIVREAVYEGRFDPPKTAAGVRQIPLSDAACRTGRDGRRQGCDAYQWALLISTHEQRHILQIREIKSDPKFPKK